ncbi:MAG: hypothetical protein Q9162_000331 [Coniocarpon cinnabarinum]
MPLPSTEQNIYEALQAYGHSKWGFVIYRTSYTPASDAMWPRFQAILIQRARNVILDSDTPQLLDHLDYKFISDPARIDGTDPITLQRIHAEWRISPDAQAEQPEGSAQVWPSDIPRYKHCLLADEDVMRSVTEGPQPPDLDIDGKSYVKFLHCDWVNEDAKEGSWMLLASWLAATEAYDVFHDNDANWYNLWRKPPEVVNH